VRLTESQRREGIDGAARERLDLMRQTGAREKDGKPPTFDSCRDRVLKATKAGDLKRQGN
jgi:hypothetical protein